VTATVDELTGLRTKLAGLRNDVLDKLCAELGADHLVSIA
jgi:hypothetical protein